MTSASGILRWFRLTLFAIVALLLSSCRPCGCKEATLINPAGVTLKIMFDYSPLPWVDDGFTVTVVNAGVATTIHGTYTKSGDTIQFKTDDKVPFLSVKSGEVNSLSCDEAKSQFTVTPAAAGGAPAVPLTFQCTKK